MPINSRQKGARGERQWRDELRANGYQARRGQQFSGSPDSPDVVCADLGWIHFEVKAVERLNIEEAMEQAGKDCGLGIADCGLKKIPVVAHRRNFRPWLVTMTAETFFRLLRGEFLTTKSKAKSETLKEENTSPRPSPQSGEGDKNFKGPTGPVNSK